MDASLSAEALLAGPVAAGTGTGRCSSCDQADGLASRSDPCRTNPKQIELKLLMLRIAMGRRFGKSLRNLVTEPRYGTSLRNNDRVAGLELDVLRHILALADFLVIKRQAAFSRGALPENVDGLLFCEIAEPAS